MPHFGFALQHINIFRMKAIILLILIIIRIISVSVVSVTLNRRSLCRAVPCRRYQNQTNRNKRDDRIGDRIKNIKLKMYRSSVVLFHCWLDSQDQ